MFRLASGINLTFSKGYEMKQYEIKEHLDALEIPMTARHQDELVKLMEWVYEEGWREGMVDFNAGAE